ncbi:SDR family NAD(P)-dependent oxidoreductase [Thiothrix lacustris]|uniref:SDR family NAD(P)-dependent oxidoreductase n=1 Tax=Thiothrix lacustris TaxID=525917 RepID=UPI0027E45F4F|nr:SDR family NAD(P)-dependent oxidoreductase [Thiothrix lacustris]WMP19417.1 SDR family NAD(P)-dependent oxidoreductase [Thiothrix lacustris]
MKPNPTFWQGKCVLVTGASSGIGKALAEHLVKQGASVGLIARRQEALEQHAASLSAAGGTVAWACADVTVAEALATAVQDLEARLGTCDVMIANAGIYHKTDVSNFNTLIQNTVVATNLQGVINTVGAVLPGMILRQRGHIVAVASIAGMIGLPAAAAYSASKAAVVTLFQSLRVDLHPFGVKTTVAAPGFVDTPLITDEERATLKELLTAEQAAARICQAVERNRAVDWFPWPTWLVCRLLSLLPANLYRRFVANIPDMEEPPTPPLSEGKR